MSGERSFLDVETTRLSPHFDDITVIGWSFGGCAKTMIRGVNAYLLQRDFRHAKFLVTFAGSLVTSRCGRNALESQPDTEYCLGTKDGECS